MFQSFDQTITHKRLFLKALPHICRQPKQRIYRIAEHRRCDMQTVLCTLRGGSGRSRSVGSEFECTRSPSTVHGRSVGRSGSVGGRAVWSHLVPDTWDRPEAGPSPRDRPEAGSHPVPGTWDRPEAGPIPGARSELVRCVVF